jgi:hypothetical protein
MKTNPIQQLEAAITARFPKAQTSLDAPNTPRGSWFLDVNLDDHAVNVEWNAKQGFGVTARGEPGFGEGVDEVYSDAVAATDRVLNLLLTRGKSVPPEPVLLRELRAERNLSQVKLAELLDIQQASISKMENRNDLLVSTLQAVVSAMGGRLVIKAMFPGGIERELRFEEPNKKHDPSAA